MRRSPSPLALPYCSGPCQAWPGTMRLWICIALFSICTTVVCASTEKPSITEGAKEAAKFVRDAVGGAMDMLRAYTDMVKANYKNSDKYFHARGNYDAARRGPGGAWAAEVISNLRETWQSDVSGRGDEDTEEDQEANRWGRSGGNPNRYRPKGLPSKY